MDDVFGHIMVPPADKYLLAGDGKATVTIINRLGRKRSYIRARLRFGQVHGAGPLARNQLPEINIFEFVRSVVLKRLNLALGHQRIERQ